MKHILAATAASLLLASCATNTPDKCIPKSEADGQPVDFGSAEAAAASRAIPSFSVKRDTKEKAATIIAKIDEALKTYALTPEGETIFLRKRLGVNRQLRDTFEAKKDIERLIELDRLHPNEGSYLLTTLKTPKVSVGPGYDRDAKPLFRILPIVSPAALNGGNSGHCSLKFDVSPSGITNNIRVNYCTKDIFREGFIKTLSRLKYSPAIRNGKAVTRKNMRTTIRFVAQDACGNTLPE